MKLRLVSIYNHYEEIPSTNPPTEGTRSPRMKAIRTTLTRWAKKTVWKARAWYRWFRFQVFLAKKWPAHLKSCYNSHAPHKWARTKNGFYCRACRMRAPFIQRARW